MEDEVKILYEDRDILAIDKPPGLVVHSDGKTKEETLAHWIVENYPELVGVGESWTTQEGKTIERPGIVHRLDRETSGVIIVAKNQDSFTNLKEQFQRREVQKEYRAFVYGKLKEDEGVIDRKIGKSRKDFRMWSAQRGARGELREALTEYRVISRREEATYLEIEPKTGRTHQIRVHMKAIHHPVVCDKLYAPNHECILGFDRLALHARSISFKHVSGEQQTVESPLPQDFLKAETLL